MIHAAMSPARLTDIYGVIHAHVWPGLTRHAGPTLHHIIYSSDEVHASMSMSLLHRTFGYHDKYAMLCLLMMQKNRTVHC